ncbi:unnamed protein product, partial [Closterium sp. Naga37s-1]
MATQIAIAMLPVGETLLRATVKIQTADAGRTVTFVYDAAVQPYPPVDQPPPTTGSSTSGNSTSGANNASLSSISNPSLALQHNFVSHAVNNQPSAVKISSRRLTRAAASSASRDDDVDSQLDRRSVLLSMAAVALSPVVAASEASAITVPKQVGAFLPKSEDGEFVVFTPGMKDTPALRAGNVSPYTFNIPPTWTQSRIANILSGNYCQPKCAEPWIEVKFEDPREGLLQVVASPMVRLTNKLELPIEEIGTPERIIAALGPFVTGDSYDPDEVVDTRIRKEGGQTYYEYYMETPYARSGAYNLASATAKGSTVLLLVIIVQMMTAANGDDTVKCMARRRMLSSVYGNQTEPPATTAGDPTAPPASTVSLCLASLHPSLASPLLAAFLTLTLWRLPLGILNPPPELHSHTALHPSSPLSLTLWRLPHRSHLQDASPCGACPTGATCKTVLETDTREFQPSLWINGRIPAQVPYCDCPAGYGMTPTECVEGGNFTVGAESVTLIANQTAKDYTSRPYTLRWNLNGCTQIPAAVTVKFTAMYSVFSIGDTPKCQNIYFYRTDNCEGSSYAVSSGNFPPYFASLT